MKNMDIPDDYLDTHHIFIGPIDFISANAISFIFKSESNLDIFINPSKSLMKKSLFPELTLLLSGVTGVITEVSDLMDLFSHQTKDPWEMAEFIGSFGVEIVILLTQAESAMVYILSTKKKYRVPAYLTQIIDPIGWTSTFFGGFASNYIKTFDPIRATAMGNALCSIKMEGSTPQYIINALPELLRARYEFLMGQIQVI